MAELNNKQRAQAEAARRAAAGLAGVDLADRAALLGLPRPGPDGRLTMRVFGEDVVVVPPGFEVLSVGGGKPVSLGDRILALHYLQHDLPVAATGHLVTFRDLAGGQFYFGPFRSRSIEPLLKRIGNDLDLLRRNLGRFDWRSVGMGDFAACIHAVGAIEATLVYHLGDEEMGPEAELLFDACVKRVYCTEDVAAIGGRICLGLL
jgi:hypothetical protein